MPLTDTGIGTGLTINPGHLTVLYDVLTGATSYDNIGLARFEYLNAGGIWGDNGYGIKDDAGTMQFKNQGGSWTDFGTGGGGGATNAFRTIAVSGQSNVVADSSTDTLTFAGGTDIAVTTNATTDTVTITSTAGGGGGAGTVTTDLGEIAYGTATDTVGGDADFSYTAGTAGVVIDFNNSTADIELSSAGFSTFGDYNGTVNGTYLYVDDPAEEIRIQSEGHVYIGDTDWGGTGNDWYADFDDPNEKLYLSNLAGGGDVYADGSGGLQIGASDKRLKKNIVQIDNALEKVTQLSGVYFDWKTENEGNVFQPMPEGRRVGFIAQDVGKVVPELMNTMSNNAGSLTDSNSILFKSQYVYGVHEKDISALLVEAIKEQQVQIDKQQKIIEELQAKIL